MQKKQSLPAKLDEQVRTSGLELTEAQTIASNYAPFFERIAEKESQVQKLEKGNALHVDMAKRIRIDLGRICSEIELQKKKDKEAVLIRGRFVDGLFNAANGYGRLTQEAAKEIEDHFERLEAERLEKLRIERIELLAPHVDNPDMFQVEHMTPEAFENLLEGQKLAKAARIEAERKAEEDRIEREKAIMLHNERKQKILPYWDFVPELVGINKVPRNEVDFSSFTEEEWLARFNYTLSEKKKHDDEQAKIAAENERLKIEAEAREKELAAERAKAEAERKAAEEKLRIEREKAEAEAARIRAEQEAKLKAEREAREKVESEIQAAKIAEQKRIEAEQLAAKKAASAPDKDKLTAWVKSITPPSFDIKDEEVKVISDEIAAKLNGFKKWALDRIKTL
jgi:hypothetical protein